MPFLQFHRNDDEDDDDDDDDVCCWNIRRVDDDDEYNNAYALLSRRPPRAPPLFFQHDDDEAAKEVALVVVVGGQRLDLVNVVMGKIDRRRNTAAILVGEGERGVVMSDYEERIIGQEPPALTTRCRGAQTNRLLLACNGSFSLLAISSFSGA